MSFTCKCKEKPLLLLLLLLLLVQPPLLPLAQNLLVQLVLLAQVNWPI